MRVLGVLLGAALLAVGAWLLWGGQQSEDAGPTAGRGADTPPTLPALRGANARRDARTEEATAAQELTDDALAYRQRLKDPTPHDRARILGQLSGPQGESIHDGSVDSHSHDPVPSDGDSGYDDGRFVIELDAKYEYQLVFTALGYRPWVSPPRRYPGGKTSDLGTVTLQRGLMIRGYVLDKGGKAYADVSVHLEPDVDPVPAWWTPVAQSNGTFSIHEFTDPEGSFAFDQLPPGPYRLRFDTEPVFDAAILDQVAAGTHSVRVVLQRQRPAPDSATPEWEAALDLRTSDGGEVPEIGLDIDGNYEIFGWDQVGAVAELEVHGMGPVDLFITPGGSYRPVRVLQFARNEERRTVVLEPGLVLTGHVRGAPARVLEGTTLEISGWLDRRAHLSLEPPAEGALEAYFQEEVVLDAHGAFRFLGLPPGRGRLALGTPALSIPARECVVSTDKSPLTVTCETRSAVDLVFKAAPGMRLGTLTWEVREQTDGGESLADWGSDHEDTRREFRTRFYRPHPGQRYTVYAQTFDPPTAEMIEVEIPADADEVIIPMRRPTVLAGRVVDTEGRAIPYALVKLHPARGLLREREVDPYWDSNDVGELPYRQARSDGRFEIAIPPTGTARLTAHHLGWYLRDSPATVRAGQGEVILVMQAGKRITGRIKAPDALVGLGAFHHCEVEAWASEDGPVVHASVASSGFFELHGLPPGKYTLVAHHDGGGGAPGVIRKTAIASGARNVALELKPAHATALDMRDESGARLTNAVVYLRGPYFARRLETTGGKEPLFVCPGAPAGQLHFDITVDGANTHRVNVKAGTTTRYVVR